MNGRGTTQSLGDLLTIVVNHLLTGMILQVPDRYGPRTWIALNPQVLFMGWTEYLPTIWVLNLSHGCLDDGIWLNLPISCRIRVIFARISEKWKLNTIYLAIVLVSFLGMLKEVIRKGFKVTSNLADKKILWITNHLAWDDSQFDSSLNYYVVFNLFSHIYTWNPNDPCFDWKGPCFGGLKPKNRGQIGSRYILWEDLLTTIIIIHHNHIRWPFLGLLFFLLGGVGSFVSRRAGRCHPWSHNICVTWWPFRKIALGVQ